MDNLWPEDIGQTGDITTPLSILQEQAHFLGDRTQNIITANVETVIDEDDKNAFIHNFYIVASVLQNYRYRLLTVQHDIELFPLKVYTDDSIFDEGWVDAVQDYASNKKYVINKNEEDFLMTLKLIFSSKKAQRIIKNLLGQSRQFGGYDTTTNNGVTVPF